MPIREIRLKSDKEQIFEHFSKIRKLLKFFIVEFCQDCSGKDFILTLLLFHSQIGGSKAGCFESYPSHSQDPYVVHKNSFRTFNDKGEKKIFRPSQGPKSCPTKSIISQNVER